MNTWAWWLYFIYVLGGNLQWDGWCCQVIGFLKGSIFNFKLNFKNALENKRESI